MYEIAISMFKFSILTDSDLSLMTILKPYSHVLTIVTQSRVFMQTLLIATITIIAQRIKLLEFSVDQEQPLVNSMKSVIMSTMCPDAEGETILQNNSTEVLNMYFFLYWKLKIIVQQKSYGNTEV